MDEHTVGNGELEGHAILGKLSWALRSHCGPTREHNEDFAGVYASTAPDDSWDRAPLFVIADGLGGHAGGEIASRLAVDTTLDRWVTGVPSGGAKGLRGAVHDANLAVIEAADTTGRRGMGTTLTALTLSGREAVVAHIGDSRAYLVREDTCAQVTVDHSRAGELLQMKLITAEQAASHPGRSQLTRCVGSDPAVPVDVSRHAIERGDVWVLCSDGLWDVVGVGDIMSATAIGAAHGPRTVAEVAERLVETAVERRTVDNVTVVVVHITSDRPIPPDTRRALFRRRA